MRSLYQVLKASKLNPVSAPDMFTALWAKNISGGGSVPTEHEYTGTVPTPITANGEPLIAWTVYGDMQQSGTPTPTNPIYPTECGDLDNVNYKIPILSGGTTTPVYLGEVQSERQIKKLVLDGTENGWRLTGSGRMALAFISAQNPLRNVACICSHYKGTAATAYGDLADGDCTVSTMNGNNSELGIYDTNYTALADFKTYLQQQYSAGTPVCVWYVLATPTTGIVNEPLRKIGTYADSISNVASIPTAAGSQTFDVDTTLKPSEVYIKYKG